MYNKLILKTGVAFQDHVCPAHDLYKVTTQKVCYIIWELYSFIRKF